MTTTTPVSSTTEPRIHQDEATSNFMRRLAGLVADIYATFSQISQKDRQEITHLEKKYTIATMSSADATRAQGKAALATAIVGLVVLAVSTAIQNPNDQLFVQKMSDQAPQLGQLFSSQYSATQKGYDGVAGIQYQKLQDKSSRAQSDGNLKETFAQVLQAEIQRLRSASASSN